MLTVILAVFSLTTLLIYYFSIRKFDYWKKRKVPYLKPTPLFGNYSEYILLKKYIGQVLQEICQKFPYEPYVGAFIGTEPSLIVQDPELIKLITTKDFYYFNSRELTGHEGQELATRNIFSLNGDNWKVIRQNLTPLFSSAKMKNMFYLIEKCSLIFEKLLDNEMKVLNIVEARVLVARFTMACISCCALGVDVDTMGDDYKSNPFTQIGNLVFGSSAITSFKLICRNIWPRIYYGLLRQKSFPVTIGNFFNDLLAKVFASRLKERSSRNDFIDLILSLKQNNTIVGDSMSNLKTGGNKKINIPVTDDLLVSQCVLFFTGGYETSATTSMFTLFELAKNSEVQNKVLKEIDEYLQKHGNQLTYECLTDLPYLEACVSEALRLYPVLGMITRETVEEYTLPTGVKLDKGMRIHLPVYHLHHNPDFFPDPEEYRPERFIPEERRNIKPYSYLPFGEGARVCIGMRFAMMQVTAGLVTILKKYRVELADKTSRTVQFDAKTFITAVRDPIKLKLITREGWEERVYVPSESQ